MRKKIILSVATIILASVFFIFYLRRSPQQSDTTTVDIGSCAPDYQGIKSQFGVTSKPIDEGILEITSSFTLLEANSKRNIHILFFLGEKQVKDLDGKSSQFKVDCGEEIVETFKIAYDPQNPQTLIAIPRILFRNQTTVPDVLIKSDPKQEISDGDALDYAIDQSDIYTIPTLEPLVPDVSINDGIEFEIVDAKLPDGFIYTTAIDNPEHTDYIASTVEHYDFKVYFSEVSNEQDILTITCLVDDVQIAAFNGQLAWSGQLEQGQGVIIEGSFEPKQGWQQLKCLVLNNVYRNDETISEFPHTLRSLFVYKD